MRHDLWEDQFARVHGQRPMCGGKPLHPTGEVQIETRQKVEILQVPELVTDDHILACALEAHAEFIVSGDRHLLDPNAYQDVPIVTAAEALRRFEAESK